MSLSTLLVKNWPWGREEAKRQGWHKVCKGKRQVRSHVIQGVLSFGKKSSYGQLHLRVTSNCTLDRNREERFLVTPIKVLYQR